MPIFPVGVEIGRTIERPFTEIALETIAVSCVLCGLVNSQSTLVLKRFVALIAGKRSFQLVMRDVMALKKRGLFRLVVTQVASKILFPVQLHVNL